MPGLSLAVPSMLARCRAVPGALPRPRGVPLSWGAVPPLGQSKRVHHLQPGTGYLSQRYDNIDLSDMRYDNVYYRNALAPGPVGPEMTIRGTTCSVT